MTTNDYRWKDIEENYNDLGELSYQLKTGASTYRGIKLGDSIDEIKKQYGIPADCFNNDDGSECIRYLSEYIPGTSIAVFLEFTLVNDVLIKAVIKLSV